MPEGSCSKLRNVIHLAGVLVTLRIQLNAESTREFERLRFYSGDTACDGRVLLVRTRPSMAL